MAKSKTSEYVPQEEEAKAISDDNARLSSILKENKDQHYNYHERVTWKVSTGSLLLDVAIGGYLSPCLVRVCGNFNEGKTPETLEIVRNFLTTVPNSKCFWVIAEGRGLSKENQERCGLKFIYKPEDWEVGTVFVLESNVFELFIKCVKDAVLNNPNNIKYCFVVDSIDGLMLKDDRQKEIEEANKVAGTPALSKKMLQSLSLGMFKFGHLMILLSQVTAEIKLDKYQRSPNRGGEFSGGNSLLHGSDWIFEYQKTGYNDDFILDNPSGKLNDGKSKPIGKWAKVMVQKSALEASRKQLVQYPIKYGKKPSGIWIEYEIADLLLGWELIKKKTAWLTFNENVVKEAKEKGLELQEQHQGMDNLRKYLEANPPITEYFYNRFKAVLANES